MLNICNKKHIINLNVLKNFRHQAITQYFQVKEKYQAECKKKTIIVDENFRMNDIIGILSTPITIDLTVDADSDADIGSLIRNSENGLYCV